MIGNGFFGNASSAGVFYLHKIDSFVFIRFLQTLNFNLYMQWFICHRFSSKDLFCISFHTYVYLIRIVHIFGIVQHHVHIAENDDYHEITVKHFICLNQQQQQKRASDSVKDRDKKKRQFQYLLQTVLFAPKNGCSTEWKCHYIWSIAAVYIIPCNMKVGRFENNIYLMPTNK